MSTWRINKRSAPKIGKITTLQISLKVMVLCGYVIFPLTGLARRVANENAEILPWPLCYRLLKQSCVSHCVDLVTLDGLHH